MFEGYGELQHFGEDNFYVVPMKAIGFRPCVRSASFKKFGKLAISNPYDDGTYAGYWWDKVAHKRLPKKPRALKMGFGTEESYKDRFDYYYYLHKDYYDN